VRCFDTRPQLMAFLGLVPSERSTGDTVRRAGLTRAGNRRARRALVEAACTYRYPARVSPLCRPAGPFRVLSVGPLVATALRAAAGEGKQFRKQQALDGRPDD
jgi:transposase